MKLLQLTLFFLCFDLIGCASNTSVDSEIPSKKASFSSQRLVIQTANLTLSVENIEDKVDALTAIVEGYRGYIQSNRRYTEKRANLNVKVPSDKLNAFVNDVSDLGTVTYKSTSSRDVTEEVIDIDAHLKSLRALRARYRELLAKANTVGEIISIEKELSKTQVEIDSIEGRRKALSNQVTMSSVLVKLEQKTIYGPLGYLGKGLILAIKKLFVIR